jgi:hypothetical protein
MILRKWKLRMESLIPDEPGLERGVQLFNYLVDAANQGKALGVAYGDFLAYLHGAASFRDLAGRGYSPGDTAIVLTAAESVTAKAGGRKKVERSGQAIEAGMDTFIWGKMPPFDRPTAAWRGFRFRIPYSREQWLLVFPNSARRLVTVTDLEATLVRPATPPSNLAGTQPASTRQPVDKSRPVPVARTPLSASQLSDLRRRLVQFLTRLDPAIGQPVKDGVAARIARLTREGLIPREIAAVMRTVTEMRNATEYESKTLSPTESAVVDAAWAAIEEWAQSRGKAI